MNREAPGLEVVSLTKRFGAFTALDAVSMRVQPGSFHALLGENGAGKTTLVKAVIGYEPPTSGDVLFDGRQVCWTSTREAHAAGIGMVYQRFTLIENMSVAENLVLVRDRVPAVVDWKAELAALDAFMASMPFRVPLRARVDALSSGEKQKLEILKQLYLRRRLLILDEPTSVLTPAEADEVLGLLHAMTRRGELTVLIITHKLREVSAFADEVTVLRRGRRVGGGTARELDARALATLMVGDTALRAPAPRAAGARGEVRLAIRSLSARDGDGLPALRELSLEVAAGEIVGVAGVSGNGQTELVEVLSGQRAGTSGSVAIDRRTYGATRAEIREHGVAVLPEVPLDSACVPDMGVSANLALRDYDLPPMRRARFFLSRRAIERNAERLIARFGVKTPSPSTPIRNLSGGNVQRAVLARELSRTNRVLVAANPCFGLDLAAAAEIRARLVDARNGGAAVLLISEDLDELMELSDRLCVMFDGRVVFEARPDECDAATLGRHMAGHA